MIEKKILLSTDIGSDPDDALTILTMLNTGMNIQGIYTVNGDVNARSYIARHIVNLAGKDIPVGRGVSRSIDGLVQPYSHYERDFVDDVFINEEASDESPHIIFKPLKHVGIATAGMQDLAWRLAQEQHTVFSIGPLTNIAMLLREYPSTVKNIQRLYVMGGSLTSGEREHNFAFDPVAAQEVLESDIPITIVPINVCEKYNAPAEMLESLVSSPAKYVRHMLRANLNTKIVRNLNYNILGENRTLQDLLLYQTEWTQKARAELGGAEVLRRSNLKERLVQYIWEISNATFEPETYISKYQQLMDLINNPDHFKEGPKRAEYLQTLLPREFAIADVFVPYCFLHPDKITTQAATLHCSVPYGQSYIQTGNKHTLVTDIDIPHFQRFVAENFR